MRLLNRLISGNRSRASMVAGLLVVMALQLAHVARSTSATWDEPHHLYDGYTVWTRHDYRLNPEVPPLVKMTAALPLLWRGLTVPPDHGWSVPREAFRDGRDFVFGNGVNRTLLPGRLACMGFTLVLGLLLYCMAAEMFGYGAGLFALALFAFDPNFLAHGALVTTDAGSACLFVAALYAFYRYSKRPTWARLLMAGVAAGLLLAAKFTGVFVFPMLLALVLVEWAAVRSAKVLRERVVAFVVVMLLAWVVLWGFYGFRYKAGVNGGDINPSLSAYLERMYDKADAPRLAVLARHHVLPEAYLWGLENTKQTEFEDTSYLWGKVYRHGNWWYFPVAMAVKSTLPFLVLVLMGLGLVVVLPMSQKRDPSTGSGQAMGYPVLWLLVPVGIYFAVAMRSDFDIGVRHLLPVYALLYVVIGGVAVALVRRDARWMYALGVLLLWQVVTSARVAPAYMAYGNEAWGGPDAVHKYLSDANTDWGQQLIAVKKYLDAHPAKECWFAYFPDGAIEPQDYGVNCKRLPTTSTVWWLDLPEAVPPVITGTVFVSDGDLEGIEFGDGALNPYEVFRERRPDAVIEHGVDVYEGSFAVPLASALVTAHDAANRLSAGDKDGALVLAQQAAQLAPESAPVEIQLGDVLVALGRFDDARAAYMAALRSARETRPDLQGGPIQDASQKIMALSMR